MNKSSKVGIVVVVIAILLPILALMEMFRLDGAGIPRMLPAIIVIGAYFALKSMFKKEDAEHFGGDDRRDVPKLDKSESGIEGGSESTGRIE